MSPGRHGAPWARTCFAEGRVKPPVPEAASQIQAVQSRTEVEGEQQGVGPCHCWVWGSPRLSPAQGQAGLWGIYSRVKAGAML